MKSLPRGLVAASVASLAVHLAAVTLPWRGVQGGAPRPALPSTLVARLIEAPSTPAAVPGSETTVPAEAAPVAVPITSALPQAAPMPLAPRIEPPAPAANPTPADTPAAAVPPMAAPDRSPDRTSVSEPAATAPGLGESRAAGLDRGPRPLDDIDPLFPAAAGTRGGTVTLRLVISDKGEVESIAVVHAVPPGLFDESALAAFGKARFAPGLRGGIPVRSEVLYEVEFAPLGKGTDSSGRTY